MQQLLKNFSSLGFLGPTLAILFLFNFSSNLITLILIIIALYQVYKRSIFAAVVFVAIALLLKQGITAPALYYPVLVNFIVFCVFTASLFSSKCLIQIFAEKIEKDLPAHAVAYCYRVNIIWSVFMAINTYLSYLSTRNLQYWSWYNGVISYLLIAVLFISELAFRKFYKNKFDKQL